MTSYIIFSKKISYKRRNLLHFYFSVLIIILIFIIPIIYISNNCDWKQFNNSDNFKIYKDRIKSSNPGPQLSFYSFQIDDDNLGNSKGDNDGNIDAGETIEMRLSLQNTGDEDAINVNATLSSLNNNITITNGFQNFINIPQNSTGMSSSYYVFKINSSCSVDYYITLNLEINASNGGPWNEIFQIHIIGQGNLVYYTFTINSESDGDLPADNDDIIDAGEIIDFNIHAKNLGGANVYGVTGIITEEDPYVTINDNYGVFDDINSRGGTNSGRFGIIVSGSCPDKHQIDFVLNLTDNEVTLWEKNFFLIVNGTSNYDIFDFHVIEYSGDGDTIIDAGESWYASITIKNIGSAIGKNVYVYFDSSDSYITFYTSSRTLDYATVNVNTTKGYSWSSGWRFTVSDTTPANHIITFSIRITDNSGYQNYFYKNVSVVGKSDYDISDFHVIEYSGDGDTIVDAGESSRNSNPEIQVEKGEIPEFDYDEWIRKEKKRRLEKRTFFFKKILPLAMYKNIVNFIIDIDLLKGRSVNKIFEQCIQIFLDDYLRDFLSNDRSVPNPLLELYFGIKKDIKTLGAIFPFYRELININYGPLGDFNFFFKDLMNLRRLYPPGICDMIKPHLEYLYRELSKFTIKDGNLASILYIISKNVNKRFTQAELADNFMITEVTLRSRTKKMKELMNQGELIQPIREITQIIEHNKTIKELIIEERYFIKNINKNLIDLVYKREYQKILEIIPDIMINHLKANLPVISHSLELISRIQDSTVISALTDFLIKYDYFNEKVFNNLVIYLGSEDDLLTGKILKLIYHYNPNLKSADIFEIIETLTKYQTKSLLSYIKASPARMKKHNSLMENIQERNEFFTTDL